MKQFSYTLSVICLLMIGAVWVRAQTLGPSGGVLISGGSFTSGDVICGAGGASIKDCGSSLVTAGGYAAGLGSVSGTSYSSSVVNGSGMYFLNSGQQTVLAANGTAGFTVLNGGTSEILSGMYVTGSIPGAAAGTGMQGASATNGGLFSGDGSSFDVTLQSHGGTVGFQLDTSGNNYFQNLGTDTGKTTRTVCQQTSNNELFFGSGAAGVCAGTSAARFKHDIHTLNVGLIQIMKLEPVSYKLNEGYGDPLKILYGFIADQGKDALPLLVGNDDSGRPTTFDYMGVVPVLVKAVQEQQVKIVALERKLRGRHARH